MSVQEHTVASSPPPSLDRLGEPGAYAHYRRLFATGLARLAASGFAAPPDEGLDLIHGFIAEVWSDVAPRYDPSRAKFDTYMFGCFVKYARPRIVRLRRTRGLLAEPALIESALAARSSDVPHTAEPSDLAAVRRALAALPASRRTVLDAYLEDASPSERQVAARFGLSRYDVRLRLSDAIGEVMFTLGQMDVLHEEDRLIARSLFGDRRTVTETAQYLRRNAASVRDTRSRWLGFLIQAVKGKQHMATSRHPLSWAEQAGNVSAGELLRAALRPEANASDEAAIREHRDALWLFLESPEAERLLLADAEIDPERLAKVYGMLGDDADGAPAGSGECDALLLARENDERDIGEAFRVLVNGVDGDAARPWTYFRGLPEIDSETLDQLHEDPSVKAANGTAAALVHYGITPVTIAEAMGSLSRFAHRFCRQHGIATGQRLTLVGAQSATATDAYPCLDRTAAIDNLARGIELPRETLERLYDWIIEVAGFIPFCFENFEAYPWTGRLLVTRTDQSEPDLFKRWRPAALAHAAGRYA